MAQFQTILGVVLLVSSIIMIAIAVYNLIIIAKIRSDLVDSNSKITDGEKQILRGTNAIMILIGLVIGVYGFILILPENKPVTDMTQTRWTQSYNNTRSVSGSILSGQ